MFISKKKLEELIDERADKRINDYKVYSCPEQMSTIESLSYWFDLGGGRPSQPHSISEIPSMLINDYNTKIGAVQTSLTKLEQYLGIRYEEKTTKGYVKNKKK
jgi:hypothetical protein